MLGVESSKSSKSQLAYEPLAAEGLLERGCDGGAALDEAAEGGALAAVAAWTALRWLAGICWDLLA